MILLCYTMGQDKLTQDACERGEEYWGGVLLNINKMVGYDLDWMTGTGDTYLWDLVSDYTFLHKELEE